ncbi:MAG: ISNCY family transposase [Aestuariivirga sp.]
MQQYLDILSKWTHGRLSQMEAAEILGVSERTFRRYARRFEADGEDGLIDRRAGRVSGRAVPDAEAGEIARLYRERYQGFTVKHFHEHLQKDHGSLRGYSFVKGFLQSSGLVSKAKRRGAHRSKRERRPLPGMMLHQDASRHIWIEGLGPLDLVVTMDDATSEITSAFLVEEEGTMSSFRGLAEMISVKGLFCSLYTDRGSHYFLTPEGGGKVSKEDLTQVGRALAQLGVEHIAAYSPEARGRSERMFGTLQDRLPKELKLNAITTVADANRFLKDTYIAAHNARFAVKPSGEGSAYVAVPQAQWRDVLCVQEERIVAADNTVSWNGKRLQIEANAARPHFVRAKVRVHHYHTGDIAIFHGPLCVARAPAASTGIPEPKRQPLAPGEGEADSCATLSTVVHSPKIKQQAVNSLAT